MRHHPTSATLGRRANSAAFALIDLAVVVAILSVLLAVAVPTTVKLVMRARTAAVENDLRVFSAAFQTYANEHGDWPPGDGTPAGIPEGMASYLAETGWQRRTPLGGYYAWDPNSLQQGYRYRAAIVIASTTGNPVTDNREQLTQLDREFDNGDLTTGNLVLGYRNAPVWVLEH